MKAVPREVRAACWDRMCAGMIESPWTSPATGSGAQFGLARGPSASLGIGSAAKQYDDAWQADLRPLPGNALHVTQFGSALVQLGYGGRRFLAEAFGGFWLGCRPYQKAACTGGPSIGLLRAIGLLWLPSCSTSTARRRGAA